MAILNAAVCCCIEERTLHLAPSVLAQTCDNARLNSQGLLLKSCDTPLTSQKLLNLSALHLAASTGHADCIRVLVSAGAHIDEADTVRYFAAYLQ